MMTQEIQRIEVDMDEIESILERARRKPLDDEEHGKLKAALETLGFLTLELESKNVSLKRLRCLLFGAPTEKLENVLPGEGKDESVGTGDETTDKDNNGDDAEKLKPKGHGRNGAEKYKGAERVEVPHESLKPGNACRQWRLPGQSLPPKALTHRQSARPGAPSGKDLRAREAAV